MAELAIGSVVSLQNGRSCRVKKELGRGGQGIVYVVDYEGCDYALKWYTLNYSDSFFRNLLKNAKVGAPADNFIWPLAVSHKQNGSFGYVMKLRPKEFKDMNQFILLHAQFSSVQAQLNACLQISTAFQSLHIRGYSYQDMNDGNFFINPQTGDVLICDNDNVAPDGTSMGILGKPGYMAPEIVEGEKMPNKYTDYYSLAVCLFILIYMNRPFEGKRYLNCPCDANSEAAKKLFGFNSTFIMDPMDDSNRPVKGIHNNVLRRWNIYPELLQMPFCKTFGKEALVDQTKRFMDQQWHNLLLQIRSMFLPCPCCGKDTFLDPDQPTKVCIWCKKSAPKYPSLKVGRFNIPLVAGQKLYECMLTGEKDFNIVSGETMMKGAAVGLVNNSKYVWTVILPDGKPRLVNPGENMPARQGFKIKFGNQGETGEIVG